MAVYYAIVTNNGLAKIAAAQSGGTQFSITHFAVGDSNGAYYEPSAAAVALAHETWRSTVNRVYVHPNNASWIVIEALIPATAGGFDIREAAAFASDGTMVAIGKYPLTNKPAVGSGSEKDLYVRMILQVSNSATIEQTIDNSLVMATQAYVDQRVPHPVRMATTGNVPLSGLGAIDGVTPAQDDRILVHAQATASQNGIYLAKSTAWVRATDFDNSLETTDGVMIVVAQGSTHADTVWLLTTNAPITLGTTALTFTKILPDESSRTISDAAAPTGDTGAPKTLFGWLAYMIKSITGKASWRTAPATTLELANTHHGRTDNPHGTTAAQIGASPSGHNHAGVYEPANANIQTHVSASAPHGGHVSHSLATAANDFLVASGVGAFVKKTLAEVKTILGLGGAAYMNTGTSNGTVATGDHGHANNANIGGPFSLSGHGHANDANIGGPFAPAAHTHSGADVVSQVASASNSDLLDNQHGSFYQNAGNMNAGTLPDARLSGNVPLKGSTGFLNQKFTQAYSGLDANGITITGLNGDADEVWDIYLRVKLTTALDKYIKMEINGDAADGNYYHSHYGINGVAARPSIGAATGNQWSVIRIRLFAKSGFYRVGFTDSWSPTSTVWFIKCGFEWRNTANNIISLRFYAVDGAVFANGSTVTIVRAP